VALGPGRGKSARFSAVRRIAARGFRQRRHIVAFRLGALDAPLLAAELGLENPSALRETANLHAWLRLMRYGTPLDPRPIQMLPLPLQTTGRSSLAPERVI
jgi:hypothetical protein